MPTLSRRQFLIFSLLAGGASIVSGCRDAATGTPAPSTPAPPSPTPTITTSPAPTITPTPQIDPDHYARMVTIQGDYRQRLLEDITNAHDEHVRLVVHPLNTPKLAFQAGAEDVHEAASMIKSMIVIYAVFKHPDIALEGWQSVLGKNVYRMIVSSHNTATGETLAALAPDRHPEQALDAFNDFYHQVLGLPQYTGLRRWEYGDTAGLTSKRVTLPPDSYRIDFINPMTLNALVAFFQMLHTPAELEAAIDRALTQPTFLHQRAGYETSEDYRAAIIEAVNEVRHLFSLPDPEITTQFEKAARRATIAYPALQFEMYGKNGVISPNDWEVGRWHLNEAVVLTISEGDVAASFILAYTASSFNTDDLFDTAFAYCADLFLTQFDLL